MKFKSVYAVLGIPAIAAGYVLFHPGIAFAATPLTILGESPVKESGSYSIDGWHTFAGFDIGHLGLSRVQGRLDKITGKLQFDAADISKSSVAVTMDVNSIDTNVPPRDADLRSPNFFDVQKFPLLTFKSTQVHKHGKGYVVVGDLTLKGVTKSVSIPFKQYGPMKDPWGGTRIGLVADPITIHRSDFGITYDADSISDDVAIRLSVEATLDKPAVGK